MEAKRHPLVVFALALALIGLMPGHVLVAGAAANLIEDALTGDAQASSESTCVIVQRGTFGEVIDGYIWSQTPRVSYDNRSLYTGAFGSGERRSLIRFGLDFLPAGAVIQLAVFGIVETEDGSGETISIYRVTQPWAEGEPTWDTFADSYDDSVAWGNFAAGGPGPQISDVTALVAAWAQGSVPNYGLLLRNADGQASDQYASSDAKPTYVGPALLVCYDVNPVNHPPVAVDDAATTDEDVPVDVDVLANDWDPDGDPLTVSDYDSLGVEGGGVSCTPAGVCAYAPPGDFNGSDTFAYTASDGRGGSATATVTVTVNPINDPPVAVDDSATTDEDVPVDVDVLDNDSDPDGDPLTVSDYDSSAAQGGAVSCTPSGVCTYTPPVGFAGTDTFAYTVDDGHGGTATATVTVEVTATTPSGTLIYLPIVLDTYPLPPGPDLVVERITVTSDDVEVVVKNQGDRPALSATGFWVDLYVAPDPVPTGVNQTWESCSSEGIVWGVPRAAMPLDPGDEVTLAFGDDYYWPEYSHFSGTFPAGAPVYVQVDSANADTTYGAVLENHEMVGGSYNNIGGPVFPTPGAQIEGPGGREWPGVGDMPPRP